MSNETKSEVNAFVTELKWFFWDLFKETVFETLNESRPQMKIYIKDSINSGARSIKNQLPHHDAKRLPGDNDE
ncbi:hypothetical protein [Butyrivibrio sp. FC2001]|uniref:hypothetical protein n=1 Tax=Butyrivibrio sp. FC2001 TaxID=1280671 RepID=UPI00047C9545|nr:hypothetical protein [Butyrivibrio sp. FC2001]